MGVLLASIALCPAPATLLSPHIGGAMISLLCLELSRLCTQIAFPDLRYLWLGKRRMVATGNVFCPPSCKKKHADAIILPTPRKGLPGKGGLATI